MVSCNHPHITLTLFLFFLFFLCLEIAREIELEAEEKEDETIDLMAGHSTKLAELHYAREISGENRLHEFRRLSIQLEDKARRNGRGTTGR